MVGDNLTLPLIEITTENNEFPSSKEDYVNASFKISNCKNAEDNFGLKVNVAEISKDKNDSNTKDIDSTPDNKVDGEDDIDKAEVMLSISTGTAPTYILLTLTVSIIMVTGIALIKKYVLI